MVCLWDQQHRGGADTEPAYQGLYRWRGLRFANDGVRAYPPGKSGRLRRHHLSDGVAIGRQRCLWTGRLWPH
jgi:hypothetical protein